MKKHFRFLSKSVLASVAISSAAVSCGLILSSCTNTNSDDNNNDNSGSNEIKIEDQSPDTHEVDLENGLTLYVVVQSNKPIKYQWFVDKNNNDGWTSIKDATESSYSIPSDSIQNITTNTTWKYKVEIYDADDTNIKITSNIYSVNIKPQSSTPDPSPKPDPDPTPPSTPNPNPSPTPPTNPDSNPSTSINQSSIELKNIRQLLPSEYLSDLTNATLDKTLIVENFDTSKITNVSYTVNALDDKAGTLSLLMKYKEDNVDKTYTFNFTNLLHFNDGVFELEFTNATDILNLSARNIADKSLNSKSKFEAFIKELESSNIKFKFKNKGNELSLNYLNFSGVEITGFDTNWFTSNNKISLTFNFKNLKINYYEKTVNSGVSSKSFEYPSNRDKSAKMWFYSAVDYLLNQVTNKSTYNTDKYASYYYYDIVNNEAIESIVQASSNYWLSNVTNHLNYNGKDYTFALILNKDSVSSENGSLTINLSMEYHANSSSANVKSKKNKDVTITGFATYDQKNLFLNSENVEGKFSLGCESENYDKNIATLSKIGKIKNLIINKISAMSESEISISFADKIPLPIINSLKDSLICKFSGHELIAGRNNNYYHNDLTAITGFSIDPSETYLRYNKTEDVFQLVISDFSIIGEGLGDGNIATNTNSMSVNITHPGDSFNKLKNA